MEGEKKSIFDFADKFGYESPFNYDWVKEDFTTSEKTQDIPTVSFKGKAPDKIEINKKTLLNFIVSGEYVSIGGNKFDVELIWSNPNLTFTTKKWNIEEGWTIRTYVTAKQEGEYIFQFKIDNKISNSLSLIFFDKNKLLIQDKEDCVKEFVNPLKLTDVEKAKFISTVIAETGMGSPYLKDIAWVYYNLVNDFGVEKGLKRSTAYKEKNRNYKLCMFYLGEGKEYKDFKYDGIPLNKYVKENEWFTNKVEPQIKEMKTFIETNIFIDKPKTCYKGWHGQGYWRDLDLNPEDGLGDKWYKARQYYWLQLEKKVTKNYIKILKDDKNTSFIFDEKSIIDFFDKNPSMLPPAKDVRRFYSSTKGLNFDL